MGHKIFVLSFYKREFDKSVLLGFAIVIDTERVSLKNGIFVPILRKPLVCIYRSTYGKHPIKNTHRFILKLAL